VPDIYHLPVLDIHGNERTLVNFQNKVLLIVNVASRCGFKYQYQHLEKWFRQYQSQGLVILGFPCNQFAGQEPEDNKKVLAFTQSCFAVSFPMFAKIDVKGPKQAPLYRFLTKHRRIIPWNFTKFLVSREGKVLHCFWPIVPMCYVHYKMKQALK
jgi:glutathione peroxidase